MNDGQDLLESNIMNILCDEKWSNSACCGYAVIACKALGYAWCKNPPALENYFLVRPCP